MLTEHDLQERVGFRSPHPALSPYLPVDPTTGSSDTHKLRLRQTLKELSPAAVLAGQMQTLVFRDGLRAPGWVCTGCGSVGIASAPACPFCEKQLEPMAEVAGHAVRRVLVEGGEMDVLSPEAGEGILGGIGAFLRYEDPARITVPGS